jgi:hypothetical protein
VNIPNLAGQTPWFAENDDQGALAAPAANDLWLVGGFFHQTGPKAGDYYFTPLVDHWNGQAWTLQKIPRPKAATSHADVGHRVPRSAAGQAGPGGRLPALPPLD